jgi:hypothetical protein
MAKAERVTALDARLQRIYADAYKKAMENQEKAIKKWMDDNAQTHPGTHKIHALMVTRARQIAERIAVDITNSGKIAAALINNERVNIMESAYKSALYDVSQGLGYDVDWAIYDKNQLKAILDYDGPKPFSKIGEREVYDRKRGKYFRDRAFGKLGEDTDIVHRLQDQLAQAVILGESIPKIATRIKGVTQMSRRQAVTVARTETLRVTNQGRMLGFNQARLDFNIPMDKQWISTNDNRTRPDHVAMQMVKVKFDDPFKMPDGSEMMQPGDPAGPARQVVRCRCTVNAVMRVKESQKLKELRERVERQSKPSVPATPENPNPPAKKAGFVEAGAHMYPATLAGQARGAPMDFDKADHFKGNPNYGSGADQKQYRINCQTCVVANEARRRGYDVQAKGNTAGSLSEKLSHDVSLVWIDPATGKKPELMSDKNANTHLRLYKWLDNSVEPGGRYTFSYWWRSGTTYGGHIISLDRNDTGELRLFDPQTNKTMTADGIKKYFKDHNVIYTRQYKGNQYSYQPEILRVDNKMFNMDMAGKILEAAKT